jgi:Zn-dependent protease
MEWKKPEAHRILPEIAAAQQTEPIPIPTEIYNCPECAHWLPPGILVCPDCQAVVYGVHVRRMAEAAQTFEEQQRWPDARAAWQAALAYLPAASQQAVALRQRVDAIDARFSAKAARKAAWTKRLGPLAPVLMLFAKIKTLLFFLLKFKFLLSFVAFFGIYWAAFGWKFGLGFSLSILIHEMGHYVAARRRGLKADMPVFIPMMGAYVKWYAMGVTLEDLAAISLAGPFFGLLVAAACAGLAIWLQSPLFSALAHVGAWLNLLNLIPLMWLDGAQATLALNRLQRGMITVTCILFFGFTREWVFLFVAAGMGWKTFTGEAPQTDRGTTLVRYILLLFLLGTVIWVFPDTGRRF